MSQEQTVVILIIHVCPTYRRVLWVARSEVSLGSRSLRVHWNKWILPAFVLSLNESSLIFDAGSVESFQKLNSSFWDENIIYWILAQARLCPGVPLFLWCFFYLGRRLRGDGWAWRPFGASSICWVKQHNPQPVVLADSQPHILPNLAVKALFFHSFRWFIFSLGVSY